VLFFEDENLEASSCEQEGGDKTVVSGADDDDVCR
jgi:hypothetical protein